MDGWMDGWVEMERALGPRNAETDDTGYCSCSKLINNKLVALREAEMEFI